MGESIQSVVGQAPPGGDFVSVLAPLVAMIAIFYFLLIRPQRKQQQQHQNLLSSLKKGDEVVLSTGLFGKVHSVEEQTLLLEIAPETRVKVLKRAVSALAPAVSAVSKAAQEAGSPKKLEESSSAPRAEPGEGRVEKGGRKGSKRSSNSAS